MPEFPISSARILLVSQIQGGQLPSLPPCPVRLWHELMIPRRIMLQTVARISEQLDPQSIQQTYQRPNHPH